MSAELDLFLARAPNEEGYERFAYNDATGKRVTCQPNGNLSIGEGINLETGMDDAEIQFLTAHRAGKVETQLQSFAWYQGLDPVRRSVLLDMAYNMGLANLLHYPRMLAALAAQDWQTAQAECHVKQQNVDQSRYAVLRNLLLTGQPS